MGGNISYNTLIPPPPRDETSVGWRRLSIRHSPTGPDITELGNKTAANTITNDIFVFQRPTVAVQ